MNWFRQNQAQLRSETFDELQAFASSTADVDDMPEQRCGTPILNMQDPLATCMHCTSTLWLLSVVLAVRRTSSRSQQTHPGPKSLRACFRDSSLQTAQIWLLAS